MPIVVLCCSGARISVRYGSLNAIFAKIAQARLKVDPVIYKDRVFENEQGERQQWRLNKLLRY